MKTFVTKDFKKTTNLLKRKHNKRPLKGDNKIKKIVSLKKTTIDSIKKTHKDSYSTSEIANFLKNAVKELAEDDMGCSTFKLDDKLAICVGWMSGYGKEKDEYIIQSKSEPDYALNAGIKDYRSDASMLIDFDWIDSPVVDGEVWNDDCTISPNEDYNALASYFLKEYKELLKSEEYGEPVEDSKHTKDSNEDLGWISTPELLEEDDFKSKDGFKHWVDRLTELKNATNKKDRLELAQSLMGYLSDFSNTYVKEEVRNDLRHVIMQHDYFFGDSSHKKNRKVKDGTFNFTSMGVFPMYCFQYLPDVYEAMRYDSKYPKRENFENEEDYYDALEIFSENYLDKVSEEWDILDEEEVEDLRNDLDDLNYDLENEAWEIENKENPSEEDLNLAAAIRDLAKFKVEVGYYEGNQIYSKYAYRADKDLNTEWIDKIESRLNGIAKKYHLTRMAGGGWTGYHKVKDSKMKKTR